MKYNVLYVVLYNVGDLTNPLKLQDPSLISWLNSRKQYSYP